MTLPNLVSNFFFFFGACDRRKTVAGFEVQGTQKLKYISEMSINVIQKVGK